MTSWLSVSSNGDGGMNGTTTDGAAAAAAPVHPVGDRDLLAVVS